LEAASHGTLRIPRDGQSDGLFRDFREADYVRDRGESLDEDDERTLVDLLVDQVEFADVILSR
jgi:hypothetical protein